MQSEHKFLTLSEKYYYYNYLCNIFVLAFTSQKSFCLPMSRLPSKRQSFETMDMYRVSKLYTLQGLNSTVSTLGNLGN